MNAWQRASCSRLTYSSGWCACSMLPGPHTTVGMPAFLNRPASVPKATSVVRSSPARRWASRVTSSSAEPRKLGISQMVSKRKPVSGATFFMAGSSEPA
jgi:hypothetical protein